MHSAVTTGDLTDGIVAPPGTPPDFRAFLDAQLMISAQTTAQHASALYGSAALDLPRRGTHTVRGGIGGLAETLAGIAKKEGWVLGRDVQVVISNDAVHYGDQGWGGKNYAPYGIGVEGLTKATANDRRLIDTYLAGPIRSDRLKRFLYELVEEKDLQTYKVTWCGRFAIPFGLEFTRRLAEKMAVPDPEGTLMAYSTSVELGQLEVDSLPPTAPSNLHHWVAYAAMGWWMPAPPRK